jgi:hypothetical protein
MRGEMTPRKWPHGDAQYGPDVVFVASDRLAAIVDDGDIV